MGVKCCLGSRGNVTVELSEAKSPINLFSLGLQPLSHKHTQRSWCRGFIPQSLRSGHSFLFLFQLALFLHPLFLSSSLLHSEPKHVFSHSQSLKISLIQFHLPFIAPRLQAETRPIKSTLLEDWWMGLNSFSPNYFLPICGMLISQLYGLSTASVGNRPLSFLWDLNLHSFFISQSSPVLTFALNCFTVIVIKCPPRVRPK